MSGFFLGHPFLWSKVLQKFRLFPGSHFHFETPQGMEVSGPADPQPPPQVRTLQPSPARLLCSPTSAFWALLISDTRKCVFPTI